MMSYQRRQRGELFGEPLQQTANWKLKEIKIKDNRSSGNKYMYSDSYSVLLLVILHYLDRSFLVDAITDLIIFI